MAKITVYPKVNKALVESEVSLETIQTLTKHRPRALELRNEEKDVYFAVGLTTGKGSVTTYGASFGIAADMTKPAAIEIDIPNGTKDAPAYVEDFIGVAIINLNKVEAQFADALAEISAEKATVRENITVA